MFVILSADRYLLTYFCDVAQVGIYSLGYKIGMLGTMLLMEPFQKVWAPFLFEYYKKENGTVIIGKMFTIFILVAVIFCLTISILSPIVLPYISGKAFHSSSKIVPLICLASIFYGMACLADAGILIEKKNLLETVIYSVLYQL